MCVAVRSLHPEGDVDLLVAGGHMPCSGGWRPNSDLRRCPRGATAPTPSSCYDAARDAWIKLDVVTELAFGRNFALATGAEAEVLSRQRRVDGAQVPADDDAFWALLLHRLLDKGSIGSRDAARLAALAQAARTDGPLAREVEALCPRGWSAARIVGEARRGEWAALSRLGPALAFAWRARRRKDVRRRAAANTRGAGLASSSR